MLHIARVLTSACLSGSVASIVGAAALTLLSQAEGKRGVRPINATSHWWHGDGAGSVREMDLPHTALGYATHHISSVFWGVLFEALRARDPNTDPLSIARDATLVSAVAAAIDYGVLPRRLRPGWEIVLPKRSVAAGLAALAAGLTLGGLITRHPPHG
jgi:hypothetical protein